LCQIIKYRYAKDAGADMHLLRIDYTVLSATRHKWTCPALTPASRADTRFTYPGGMEGWVDLCSLIVARLGIKLKTARSQVRRPNRYATKPQVSESKLPDIVAAGLLQARWPSCHPSNCINRNSIELCMHLMGPWPPCDLDFWPFNPRNWSVHPCPKMHNLSFGSRAFRISAPKIWNSLPPHILQSQTLDSFRCHLKTYYFQSAYPAP